MLNLKKKKQQKTNKHSNTIITTDKFHNHDDF